MKKLIAFFFVILISIPGFAARIHGGTYLKLNSIDLSAFPAPPTEGSEDDIADLTRVRAYQTLRTKEQCLIANDQAGASLRSFFVGPKGPLSENEAKMLSDLYSDVLRSTDLFVVHLKEQWHRPRPYLRDAAIKLCVPSHPASSYPSGHAAISQSAARVLSVIFPQREGAFMDRAAIAAESRVLGGVHHPSDVAAGRLLGDMVFEALMKNPDFQSRVLNLRLLMRRNNR